jgi:hypothetical protein
MRVKINKKWDEERKQIMNEKEEKPILKDQAVKIRVRVLSDGRKLY